MFIHNFASSVVIKCVKVNEKEIVRVSEKRSNMIGWILGSNQEKNIVETEEKWVTLNKIKLNKIKWIKMKWNDTSHFGGDEIEAIIAS